MSSSCDNINPAITALERFFGIGTRPHHIIAGGIGLLFLVAFLGLFLYMAVTWWRAFLAHKYIGIEALPANAGKEGRDFDCNALNKSPPTWPRRAAHQVEAQLKKNRTEPSTTNPPTNPPTGNTGGLWIKLKNALRSKLNP